MESTFRATFRDRVNGDVFRIRFEWISARRTGFFRVAAAGHYRLFVETRPNCSHPLGRAAHLLDHDEICVAAGREPHTKDRAKAIAMLWLRGFGYYRRTGQFPNEGGRVNVVES